ncbi:hypothetical protein ACFE04_022505 [Oxalis oulophora]
MNSCSSLYAKTIELKSANESLLKAVIDCEVERAQQAIELEEAKDDGACKGKELGEARAEPLEIGIRQTKTSSSISCSAKSRHPGIWESMTRRGLKPLGMEIRQP